MKFKCLRCGNCCKGNFVPIVYSDIKRWESQKHADILSKVAWLESDGQLVSGFYFQPISPSKAASKDFVCPFLSKENTCSIHVNKPKACKHFPITASDETLVKCEGIKSGSMINPKLIPKIRSKLDEDGIIDMRNVIQHKNEILALLLWARYLDSSVKKGEMIFNASEGKYVSTDKGMRLIESQEKKLEKIASERDISVKEVVNEMLLRYYSKIPKLT
jgi:Fe-S-cluster containining protein